MRSEPLNFAPTPPSSNGVIRLRRSLESGGSACDILIDLSCGKLNNWVGLDRDDLRYQRIKSAHFCRSVVPGPQGSIGTLDVEFLGEPSTSLSL
jgi:hypothetical protein